MCEVVGIGATVSREGEDGDRRAVKGKLGGNVECMKDM